MNTWRANGTITGAGVLSAIAASLCCISPVAALLAGGSLAANFSWIEPARPYLIGISISVLSLVWYMKLKLKPKEIGRLDCPCD